MMCSAPLDGAAGLTDNPISQADVNSKYAKSISAAQTYFETVWFFPADNAAEGYSAVSHFVNSDDYLTI